MVCRQLTICDTTRDSYVTGYFVCTTDESTSSVETVSDTTFLNDFNQGLLYNGIKGKIGYYARLRNVEIYPSNNFQIPVHIFSID